MCIPMLRHKQKHIGRIFELGVQHFSSEHDPVVIIWSVTSQGWATLTVTGSSPSFPEADSPRCSIDTASLLHALNARIITSVNRTPATPQPMQLVRLVWTRRTGYISLSGYISRLELNLSRMNLVAMITWPFWPTTSNGHAILTSVP